MKLKITKANIDKIKHMPEGIYRDNELIGFAVRVRATKQTYIIDKKLGNRVIRKTVGNVGTLTPEQARKQAQILLGEIAKGTDINAEAKKEKAKSVTLKQAYNDYKSTKKLDPIKKKFLTLDDIHDLGIEYEPPVPDTKKQKISLTTTDVKKKKIKGISAKKIKKRSIHIMVENGKVSVKRRKASPVALVKKERREAKKRKNKK